MERSFKQIEQLIKALDFRVPIRKGSDSYLQNNCPVRSEVVDHLIALAKDANSDELIYVMGLACATNLASAILIAPDIRDKVGCYDMDSRLPYKCYDYKEYLF